MPARGILYFTLPGSTVSALVLCALMKFFGTARTTAQHRRDACAPFLGRCRVFSYQCYSESISGCFFGVGNRKAVR